ncbi:MAG: hypothetical protein KY396_09540, partial [Actinobacteria bacterium]|nr:hypothetical protein [Actinomycetota bacterium]
RVTTVEVTLPSDAADTPHVELRIVTTNAAGADEWGGVDAVAVTGTPLPPADTTPPALSLGAESPQPLVRALRAGVRVKVTLGEPASVRLAVRISRWLAARLELSRVVGTATRAADEGETRMVVRFDRSARRKLATRARVRVTLTAVATDGVGNASRARTKAALVR